MAEKFYTILTNVGKAKITNAATTGTKVNFAKLVLGDSGGSYYEPTQTQTALKHKVWEGQISNVKVHESNQNWIVVETVIPGNVGGFTIREVGIVDDTNNLLVIAKHPESYKPSADDGTIKDMIINLVIEVSNASAVKLKIDPTVILATKKDVDDLRGKYLLKSEKASDSDKLDGLDSSAFARREHTHTKSQITDFAHTHAWNDISGKPNSFTPGSHRHSVNDVDNIMSTIVGTKVNNAVVADKLTNQHGTPIKFNWAGQGGQPAWLWGGNDTDHTNMYVYNPSNFNVNYANNTGSVLGFQFRNNNGQLEVLVGGVWLSVGAKQYTVKRDFSIRADGSSKFEYYGSGIFKKLGISGSQDTKQWISISLDDVLFNYDDSDVGYVNIEFKNSFKVIAKQGYVTNVGVYGFIQTEK